MLSWLKNSKKIPRALLSLAFIFLTSFSHSEEIQLQAGDFFFIQLNPEETSETTFITLDSQNNNQPDIYTLGLEERFLIQLEDSGPISFTLNVSSNTLSFSTYEMDGDLFGVQSEGGEVDLTGLSTPNVFNFVTGTDSGPSIQLLRVSEENITFSSGDDPNVYVSSPQGIEVIVSALEAPTPSPPSFENASSVGKPDDGPLNDDPIPDTPAVPAKGGCQISQNALGANTFLMFFFSLSFFFLSRLKKA